MAVGNTRIYITVFLGVFIFMLIIGVSSEVSLSAGLGRAVIAAAIFTALLLLVVHVITRYLFQDNSVEPAAHSANVTVGRNLDISADQSVSYPLPTAVPGQARPNETLSEPIGSPPDFVPLAAKQIDPQVSKIINSDPNKLAEIVRKMGLEEN